MKANLTVRGSVLNGYLNIDPTANPQESDRVLCQLDNLDGLIDSNELEEFLVGDTLDFVPIQARQTMLTHWLAKVSHGGTFVMAGLDVNEATRVISNGSVEDLGQVNQTLYGTNVSRKSISNPQYNIQVVMNTRQFDLVFAKYAGLNYVLTFRRK